MMRGALPVARGLVLCPGGAAVTDLPGGVEVLAGGHPEPTARGIENSRRIAAAVAALTRGETLLLLLSGGASSLLEVPGDGVSCDELIDAHRALVASGAPIAAINRVRCCLSAVKGGALAKLAEPARVCTLAVSDVVGDDPAAIGSAPTFPVARDAREALEIITRHSMQMPSGVLDHLGAMAHAAQVAASAAHPVAGGDSNAAVGPNAAAHANGSVDPSGAVDYEIVAGVGDAIDGAAAFLEARGCHVSRRTLALTCDTAAAAAEVAQQVGALLDRTEATGNVAAVRDHARSRALQAWLAGGETTVRVPADCSGRGGRNLDLAARLALALAGREGFACAVAGTDGRDGSSRGAGAVIDGGSAGRAAAAGLALEKALARFDTEPALAASGDLLVTGPTGTNVGDLLVAVTA